MISQNITAWMAAGGWKDCVSVSEAFLDLLRNGESVFCLDGWLVGWFGEWIWALRNSYTVCCRLEDLSLSFGEIDWGGEEKMATK